MPWVRLAAGLALLVFLGGCWSARAIPAGRVSQPLEVVADWNDVEAAVLAATGRVEMAFVSQAEAPGRHVFELRTIRDEPAELVFTCELGALPEGERIPIRIWCSVGRFGDSGREAQVLRAVAKRLGDLAGVDFAPIRW